MDKYEFDRITTRGGDRGESSLVDGQRRRKDDLYFETLGTLDELISVLGEVRADIAEERKAGIAELQKKLQTVSGMVAVPKSSELFEKIAKIGEEDVEEVERLEHELLGCTEVPQEFILPGDGPISARIHVARTVCRRVERRIVTCIRDRGAAQLIPAQKYINRLADYLFLLALSEDRR